MNTDKSSHINSFITKGGPNSAWKRPRSQSRPRVDNNITILPSDHNHFITPSTSGLAQEPVLLMHYLDNVFPAHFHFYDPSQYSRGRGWLLSLLMQTKPVYHTALGLSAYSMSLSTPPDSIENLFWRDEMARHHTLALNLLQESLEGLNASIDVLTPEAVIEVLAGIAQLICFEVCRAI